jgi:hypothetical protein
VHYALLGSALPNVPVWKLRLSPSDPDLMIAATQGRGVYSYAFCVNGSGSCTPKAAATVVNLPFSSALAHPPPLAQAALVAFGGLMAIMSVALLWPDIRRRRRRRTPPH